MIQLIPTSCAGKKSPHIFIIMIDAARYDLLEQSIDQNPLMKSIHQFAQTSIHYSYCVASAPYTGPSVVSMLTGLYPETHSVRKPGSQASKQTPFIQKKLSDKGYQSTIITGNAVLLRHRLLQGFNHTAFIRPLNSDNQFAQSTYQNIEQAQSVLQNLDYRHPQFVYIHLLPPHEPYLPPKPWSESVVEGSDDRYEAYLRNAAYADYLIGELLARIKKLGLFDDAVIIVGSDHGEAFGEHGHYGHITTVYNEMIRVPLFLKLPNQTAPNIIDTPCGLIDICPTILKHLNIPPDQTIQGRPLPSKESSITQPKPQLYCRAIGSIVNASLIEFPLKYIHTNGKDELYHLQTDPAETQNLAISLPEETARLKKALFDQLKQNLKLRTQLRITPSERQLEFPELMKELETLGYL